jgi:hypothetical protein
MRAIPEMRHVGSRPTNDDPLLVSAAQCFGGKSTDAPKGRRSRSTYFI